MVFVAQSGSLLGGPDRLIQSPHVSGLISHLMNEDPEAQRGEEAALYAPAGFQAHLQLPKTMFLAPHRAWLELSPEAEAGRIIAFAGELDEGDRPCMEAS